MRQCTKLFPGMSKNKKKVRRNSVGPQNVLMCFNIRQCSMNLRSYRNRANSVVRLISIPVYYSDNCTDLHRYISLG